MKSNVIFTNDNNVNVKLIKHDFSESFIRRDKHEVMFRRINTYLIKNKLIDENVIEHHGGAQRHALEKMHMVNRSFIIKTINKIGTHKKTNKRNDKNKFIYERIRGD